MGCAMGKRVVAGTVRTLGCSAAGTAGEIPLLTFTLLWKSGLGKGNVKTCLFSYKMRHPVLPACSRWTG